MLCAFALTTFGLTFSTSLAPRSASVVNARSRVVQASQVDRRVALGAAAAAAVITGGAQPAAAKDYPKVRVTT